VLFRLRTARIARIGIARIFMVALLALVMLAGMMPSGAFSESRICRMACCVGKPPHEAGACNAVLPSADTVNAEQEAQSAEHAIHHDGMEMSVTVDQTVTETETFSGHCQTANHSSTEHRTTNHSSVEHRAPSAAPSHAEQSQQASFAADAFTKPCSEECAAAALAFMQVRRPRAAAVHSHALKPRPPTLISRADSLNSLFPSSAAHGRQSRPRAPPASLVNLNA
jgi:hypothetical protein